VPILKLRGIPTRAMDLGENRVCRSSILVDLIDAGCCVGWIPLAKGWALGYNSPIE
jgi:hypothetical protein